MNITNLIFPEDELGEMCSEKTQNLLRKSFSLRSHEENIEDCMVLKRVSMYQSSSEVRSMRKLKEGRRKVDSAFETDAFLPHGIVDDVLPEPKMSVLCYPEEKTSAAVISNAEIRPSFKRNLCRHPIMRGCESLDPSLRDVPDATNFNSDSSRMDCMLLTDPHGNEHPEICLEAEEAKCCQRNKTSDVDFSCKCTCKLDFGFNESNDGERSITRYLPKSFSENVQFDSPSDPNLKVRSSSLRKMLNPIMKSRSLKTPPVVERKLSKNIEFPSTRRNKAAKSLLSEFSKTTQEPAVHGLLSDDQLFMNNLSPAHLKATLQLDKQDGVPFFRFSVKGTEDVLLAKSWKPEKAHNWFYTFHSYSDQTNSTRRTTKGKLFMVGQMQVTSYICSEMMEDGLNNSALIELVLYSTAHATCSDSSDEGYHCNDNRKDSPLEISYRNCVLNSHHEIAAAAVKIPFKAGDSRDKNGETDYSKGSSHPTGVASVAQSRIDSSFPGLFNVVIPSGTHGSPSSGSSSPLSLLERWRYGGGCDCGGWDMGCPITVLENCKESAPWDALTTENETKLLFVQGRKEKLPALTISAGKGGQYSIHFHALLSALQAFSICIALLHSLQALTGISALEEHKQGHSFRFEEVLQLIKMTSPEENLKRKQNVEWPPPSFALDPPFSPLGRV